MTALQSIAPSFTIQQQYRQSARAELHVQASAKLQEVALLTGAFGAATVRDGALEERLFESRAGFKILTSRIAMHLPDEWRDKLFRQIDSLIDAEEWEPEDLPPKISSSLTFLRMLLALNTTVRPGLGATADGNLIAAWTNGANHLTVECLAADRLRWSVRREINGEEEMERAAGTTAASRLQAVLSPYRPEIWFERA